MHYLPVIEPTNTELQASYYSKGIAFGERVRELMAHSCTPRLVMVLQHLLVKLVLNRTVYQTSHKYEDVQLLYRMSSKNKPDDSSSEASRDIQQLLDWGLEEIEWAVDKFKALDT